MATRSNDAIVRDPQAFLFDEPLSNLDAKLRMSARAEIRRMQQRLGVTTVYVTHDQVEAMTLADRMVVMHDGCIQQVGRPLDIYARPASSSFWSLSHLWMRILLGPIWPPLVMS